jgi:hypothetical protein
MYRCPSPTEVLIDLKNKQQVLDYVLEVYSRLSK